MPHFQHGKVVSAVFQLGLLQFSFYFTQSSVLSAIHLCYKYIPRNPHHWFSKYRMSHPNAAQTPANLKLHYMQESAIGEILRAAAEYWYWHTSIIASSDSISYWLRKNLTVCHTNGRPAENNRYCLRSLLINCYCLCWCHNSSLHKSHPTQHKSLQYTYITITIRNVSMIESLLSSKSDVAAVRSIWCG
jgi:hypothetical protein